MDWAQKRKILYAVGFASIIVLLASYPAYKVFYKTPTCFDKKKNGTEAGVDCGGGCALQCSINIKPPHIVWAKVFSIGDALYDIGSYVENVNTGAGLKSARYTFRVFNAGGDILAEKSGETELAPGSGVLLFETGIAFSDIPTRVEVSFDSNDFTKWTKATQPELSLVTKNKNLKNVDTSPRFDAIVVNNDPVNDVSNLSIGAVIYDQGRRPVAISKTYIDSIPKNSERDIFFTWPKPFTTTKQNFITEIIITPRAVFVQ